MAAILLGAAPFLVDYRSVHRVVLGRWSAPFAALLALLAATALGFLWLGTAPGGAAERVRRAVFRAAHGALAKGVRLGIALALLWTAFFLLLLATAHVELGRSLSLLLLASAAVLWTSIGAVLAARAGPRERARSLGRLLLCLAAAASAWGVLEVFLRSRPAALPTRLLYELPGGGEFLYSHYDFDRPLRLGYRFRPGIRLEQKLLASSANLYTQQPRLLRPVPPAEDRVLMEASFTTDENGYRNDMPLHATYPVVVSGDSFTMLVVEPRPWPAVLSTKLGAPVLNLGLQGYGPQAEVEAIIQFGLPRRPRWAVVAYFEGNDLIDAENYEKKRASGLGWAEYDLVRSGILERSLAFQLVRFAARRAISPAPDAAGSGKQPKDPPYPFTVEVKGRPVELSFSVAYLSRLSLDRAQVESLAGFGAAVEAFARLDQAARAAGARLLVVYCPSKERCYLPLLPGTLATEKLGGALRARVGPGRELLTGRPGDVLEAGDLFGNMDGQRDALAAALESRGVAFLDMTPAFRAAASSGEQLYFASDTHWTAAGHELAASTILKRLEADS